jgi:hypothetical protein
VRAVTSPHDAVVAGVLDGLRRDNVALGLPIHLLAQHLSLGSRLSRGRVTNPCSSHPSPVQTPGKVGDDRVNVTL